MSVNDSQPGKGRRLSIRSLFRPSSPAPSSPPSRRRVPSFFRRSILSQKPSIPSSHPASGHQVVDSNNKQQPFDPASMIDISEAPHGNSAAVGFDILEWYPRYQNCQRYFLDQAQHSITVQGLSAFLNIRLPFQRQSHPVFNSEVPSTIDSEQQQQQQQPSITTSSPPSVSLIPYIRRLVATGMDFPGVLQGFFGDEWGAGIGLLHEQERRNYLFAAKSGGWASVKKDYDIPPQETIPFLRPLQGPLDPEIEAAERSWSEWLAMEDWMVGPRAIDLDSSSQASRPRS